MDLQTKVVGIWLSVALALVLAPLLDTTASARITKTRSCTNHGDTFPMEPATVTQTVIKRLRVVWLKIPQDMHHQDKTPVRMVANDL